MSRQIQTYLSSLSRHLTRIGKIPDFIRSSIGGFLSLDNSFLLKKKEKKRKEINHYVSQTMTVNKAHYPLPRSKLCHPREVQLSLTLLPAQHSTGLQDYHLWHSTTTSVYFRHLKEEKKKLFQNISE